MNTVQSDALSPREQAQFSAMTERMRQMRRHSGVPDGMTAREAIGIGIITADELERTRWGTGSAALDGADRRAR